MNANDYLHSFASDNAAGLCPEAWRALEEANAGFTPGYGSDEFTTRSVAAIQQTFESNCEVFFTSTGTAANSLAIASLCHSYHAVIAADCSHLETDECGAPEFFTGGAKIALVPSINGKLTPNAVEQAVQSRRSVHSSLPRVLSLTQPTEWGTLYSLEELRALRDTAREYNLRVHLDGARFANAVAALQVSPREIIEASGADVLCLGGSKGGLSLGEAVLVFDGAVAPEFIYRCKQSGQLMSKMRYLSAPWATVLSENLWLGYAQHGLNCTKELASRLSAIPGVSVARPVESNAVFLSWTDALKTALRQRGWAFYDFPLEHESRSRLMCSWATRQEAMDRVITEVSQVARDLH